MRMGVVDPPSSSGLSATFCATGARSSIAYFPRQRRGVQTTATSTTNGDKINANMNIGRSSDYDDPPAFAPSVPKQVNPPAQQDGTQKIPRSGGQGGDD